MIPFWAQVQVEAGDEAPCPRGGAACCALDSRRLLIHGGADRTPTAFADFWLLELDESGVAAHWSRLSPTVRLPKKRRVLPRSSATLTHLPAPDGGPGKVYLFGGQEPVEGVCYNNLLSLDAATWELTEVEHKAGAPRPPARHSHVAGAFGGRGVIVFGGAGLRGPLSDVWLFDAEDGEWRCLSADLPADVQPAAREMAAGCMLGDAGLLVHGGRGADGGLLDDLAIFDARAGRWVLMQGTGFARCAHSACNVAPAAGQAPAAAASPAQPGQPEQPASSGSAGNVCDAAAAAAAAAGGPEQEGNDEVGMAPEGAAASGGTSGGSPGGTAGGGAATTPQASNVLLLGGFTGQAVASELLQLTFLRRHHGSTTGLRAELRPVRAAEGAPPPRFAQGAAVLAGPGSANMVVVAGVNQTDDLSDIYIWRAM